MKVFIYTGQKAHGIIVIVENLVKAFCRKGVDCSHITSLNGRNKDDIIIPYGVKESNELLNKGYRPIACFMADAITLGHINKIKFYLRIGHFFHHDFLYSIYGYLRYTPQEKKVVENYKNAVFVAQRDIDFLKEKYPHAGVNYLCVPNGGPSIKEARKATVSDKFRIGLLSAWGANNVYEESNWFVKKYWPKYHQKHKNAILKIAGRGEYCWKFKDTPGAEVLGEVSDLAEFFANCDVSLLLCPKGCGILNRVLDSFAYQIPVIGYEASFTGFPDSDDVCYKFNSYDSFEEVMERIMNNPEEARDKTAKAIAYANERFNWERNYDDLTEELLRLIKKEI